MAPATVVVTGANRGIGYGLVKHFLDTKDIKKVIATARKPDEATELKALNDPRLSIVQMEVSCDKSIEAAAAQVEKIVGDEGLNLLVNNAGIFVEYNPRDKVDRAEFTRQLDVNSISPVVVTQYFLPLLQKAAAKHSSDPLSTSRAAIANISSSGGSIGLNDPKIWEAHGIVMTRPLLAYRVSKSALNMVTKELGNDLGKDGILVACFCPGWVQTDMGGEKAQLSLDDSMNDLVPTILNLKPENQGGYFNQKGEVIPY